MAHINAKQNLVLLGDLKTILTDLGFAGSKVVAQSAELPFPALLVPLEADAHGRARFMTLMFYPAAELEKTLLLQYYIEFPFSVAEAHLSAYAALLPALNHRSVVGYFGLPEGNLKPYFRYVQALQAGQPITEVQIADVVALFSTTADLFQDILEAVASGASSVPEAQKQINEKLQA